MKNFISKHKKLLSFVIATSITFSSYSVYSSDIDTSQPNIIYQAAKKTKDTTVYAYKAMYSTVLKMLGKEPIQEVQKPKTFFEKVIAVASTGIEKTKGSAKKIAQKYKNRPVKITLIAAGTATIIAGAYFGIKKLYQRFYPEDDDEGEKLKPMPEKIREKIEITRKPIITCPSCPKKQDSEEEEEEEEEEECPKTEECANCYENRHAQEFHTLKCGHKYCKYCLCRRIEIQLEENQDVIPCLYEGCKKNISDDEDLRMITGDDFVKVSQYIRNLQVNYHRPCRWL